MVQIVERVDGYYVVEDDEMIAVFKTMMDARKYVQERA